MSNYNKTLFKSNKINYYENQKKLLNAWDNKSQNYKIRLLKKVCREHFNNVKIKFDNNISFYVKGYFDSNKGNEIIINSNLLNEKTGIDVYATIYHEYNHYLQYKNFKNKKDYEHIYLSKDVKIKSFSNNQLYVSISNKYNRNITNKLLILNQLCRYERESYFKEYISAVLIDNSYSFPLANSIKLYKDIYCSNQLSKGIFKTIDDCFYKVYNNKKPSNNLEATIMYDICIISLFQAENISEVQFLEYMNDKNKERILEENNYEIYSDLDEFIPSNSLDYLCMDVREKDYILKEINKLNEIQIKNNPKLMTLAKHYYPDEVEKILEAKKINYNNIESEKELC